jgi:hypothetical protein
MPTERIATGSTSLLRCGQQIQRTLAKHLFSRSTWRRCETPYAIGTPCAYAKLRRAPQRTADSCALWPETPCQLLGATSDSRSPLLRLTLGTARCGAFPGGGKGAVCLRGQPRPELRDQWAGPLGGCLATRALMDMEISCSCASNWHPIVRGSQRFYSDIAGLSNSV